MSSTNDRHELNENLGTQRFDNVVGFRNRKPMNDFAAQRATDRAFARAYATAAARAGQDHANPEVVWLARHMDNVLAKGGQRFARAYGRAIALHLAACVRGAAILKASQSREVFGEVAA